MKIIGITGGIGSGKSVVSRILRLKGMRVYDCDLEARRLMEENSEIKCRIRDEISADVTDGSKVPDRKILAGIVFNDDPARLRLNAIVHEAVRRDVEMRAEKEEVLFVESAILAESGLAEKCSRIWRVIASEDIRIERAAKRDGCGSEEIRRRMDAQTKEEELLSGYAEMTDIILNDESHSLLRRVDALLRELNQGR